MNIPKLKYLDSNNFVLIAGPCAIEGEEMAFKIAERILSISNKYNVPFIFKACSQLYTFVKHQGLLDTGRAGLRFRAI